MTPRDGGTPSSLVARIRARDERIPYVERAFLARQLGLGRDDVDLLPDAAVDALLDSPTSVMNVIGAERLLEQLDAVVARAHPVNLDYPYLHVTVATVLFDDEDTLVRMILTNSGNADAAQITLDVDGVSTVPVSIDEAEAVAYALLRLVAIHRQDLPAEPPPPAEYTNQVIGTDNGPTTEENR